MLCFGPLNIFIAHILYPHLHIVNSCSLLCFSTTNINYIYHRSLVSLGFRTMVLSAACFRINVGETFCTYVWRLFQFAFTL